MLDLKICNQGYLAFKHWLYIIKILLTVNLKADKWKNLYKLKCADI